jgi:hypothetical protein
VNKLKIGVAAIAALIGTPALAADMVTKAPPPAAVTAPAACGSLWDFIVTSCPLSWYGITIYGTVDTGVTWQSHGTPFNGKTPWRRISHLEEQQSCTLGSRTQRVEPVSHRN